MKNGDDLLEKLNRFKKQFERILNLQLSFLLEKLDQFKKQLGRNIMYQFCVFKDKLTALEKTLKHPRMAIQDFSQSLDENHLKLNQSIQKLFNNLENKIYHYEQVISTLDHHKIMKRGFSIVTRSNGGLIFCAEDLNLEENLSIEFFEGQAKVKVIEKKG